MTARTLAEVHLEIAVYIVSRRALLMTAGTLAEVNLELAVYIVSRRGLHSISASFTYDGAHSGGGAPRDRGLHSISASFTHDGGHFSQVDGWLRFHVSAAEHALLLGVRAQLFALLKRRVDSPAAGLGEAGTELLRTVGEVLGTLK